MILLFKEQQNSTASKVTTLYLTFEELKTCSIEIVPKHTCIQHNKKKKTVFCTIQQKRIDKSCFLFTDNT